MSSDPSSPYDLIHAPPESLLGSWMDSINSFLAELRSIYPLSTWLSIREFDRNQIIDGLNQYLIHDRLSTLDYLGPVLVLRSKTRFFVLRLTRTVTRETYLDRWKVGFGDEHYSAIGRISSVAFTGMIKPRRSIMARAISDYHRNMTVTQTADRARGLKVVRSIQPPSPAPQPTAPKVRPAPADPADRVLRHINQAVHGLPPPVATALKAYLIHEYLSPLSAIPPLP